MVFTPAPAADQKLSNVSLSLTAVDFDPFEQGELSATSPTTEPQREIWLSAQMSQDANCAFNESQTLRLRGTLNIPALRSGLQTLVQQHEALRMTFSPDGEKLCIVTTIELAVPVIDLSDFNDRDRQIRWEELRRQEVLQPFDLINGPLIRAQIIRLQAQEHLLVLTGHHIVCDGWSWGVILPDLAALYSAVLTGETADIELPNQFSEYALLQQQLGQSSEFRQAEKYWLKRFSSIIPVLDLPRDRPRPALKTYTADREDWTLNPVLLKDLKRVGAKAGCSFFTTLLVGFEVFLSRLTGQSDLVVGLPAAGQSFSGQERLVGHCVNFLPLDCHIEGEQPFVTYLKMRRSEIMDAYEHQQLSFGGLIQKLPLPRDASRTPLVSVVFNYDRALSGSDLPFEGLEAELFSNPRYFENFELFINATEADGNLILECQYNTDLFDAATIRRRLEAFEVLLSGVVADPQQPIWKLPIVSPSEAALLQAWNRTQVAYGSDLCLHHLVEAQAERTPDAIAVVFGSQQLTYQDLNARANQLARYLQSLGVGPEVLVGICLDRSLEMVIALLAILKAGGAYVPLDAAHPVDRIAYVLEDTAAPILLTQRSLSESLPAHVAQVISLDAEQPQIAQQKTENLAIPVTASNLAYVIYTSGSTGRPKGVQIEHHSVINLLNAIQAQPGLTAQDKLLSVTTISFDISVAEIFLPLSIGAQLVLASRDVASDGAKLLALLNSSGATFLQPTPVTWQLLLAAGWRGSPNLKMISTGEALPSELASQLLPQGAALWNLYGPTETTIWSSTYRVEPGKPILIGRPLDNTQFYVLDAHLQPVPIGVAGELYIGGDGLARGYLKRPDLTAEKFISNPFFDGVFPGSSPKLYKTGDLVRYCADGAVECLGRIDYQVKIRGFRIELGEIEALLSQHSAVQEAVVVAREDSPGNKRLVAYIVPAVGRAVEVKDLQAFVSTQLPDYMRPVAWVVLAKFPLTGSGKVDRKALPMPEVDRQDNTQVAPKTQTEQTLAKIWETVLDVHPIGIHDNFFDLGGHSLLAVRLWTQIQSAFQTELPLSTLFQAQTIADLSDRLGPNEPLPGNSKPLPASPALFVIQPGLPGTQRRPLFCLHVLGEGCSFFRPLAAHLSAEYPIYGLAAQMLDEANAPVNQVEALATYYIQEMQALQPEGPYYLLGVSFGGDVAFEVARQLAERGQKTALVGLMDTYGPGEKPLGRSRLSTHLSNLRTAGPTYLVKKVRQRLKTKTVETGDRLLSKCYRLCKRLRIPTPYSFHIAEVRTANIKALKSYAPRPYPGQVTVFRATEEVFYSSNYLDSGLGWSSLALGGVNIEDVPGDHMGILSEPHVQVLAEKLQGCVDRTEQDF